MEKFKDLIPENIAPKDAKRIVVCNSAEEPVCYISLGHLQQPNKDKKYSFTLLADVHITYDTAEDDFIRALTYTENSDSAFTVIAGDLTGSGTKSELERIMDLIRQYANKDVEFIPGNHENFSTISKGFYEEVTGKPLYYYREIGNDVLIMVGHYGGYQGDGIGWLSSEFVSLEEIQWLYETLEKFRNRRCFVVNHVYPYDDGVGDANRYYDGRYWLTTDGGIGQAYIELLKHYKNAILFCAHSHLRYYLQKLDKKANYSSAVGYKSAHVSSLTVPRDRVDGSTSYIYAESEGYIVDVYDDYIILNGRDFIDNDADGHIIPIATYKIDTKLIEIEAGTFTDSTGIITT